MSGIRIIFDGRRRRIRPDEAAGRRRAVHAPGAPNGTPIDGNAGGIALAAAGGQDCDREDGCSPPYETAMKLDMELGETRSAMRIVLNPVGESPLTGLPVVIQNCTTIDALEAQLQQIEKQMAKIRKEAAKFFKVAPTAGSS
jgi:hypothetical protein